MRILAYLLTLGLALNLTYKNSNNFEWPENEISPIFKEFLVAFNANDPQILETFTEKHFDGDHPNEFAAYWRGVYSEYGELNPYQIHQDFNSPNSLGIWFQGKDTKGWVMIVLWMNDNNTKVLGKSVMRGMRPSNLKRDEQLISVNEIGAHLASYLETSNQKDHFSGSVLIAKGDKILFENTYGMSNLEKQIPIDINTSFCIASTSKTFTAVAIAQLVEKGMIKYSDYIEKYIPEYPKDIANQVTIEHLLTHTSGIEIDDYQPFNEAVNKSRTTEDLLDAQLKYIDHMNEGRRKNFKPLIKYDYSNENFSLLGIIIERVSGQSFGDYIRNNILKPVEMSNSYSNYKTLKEVENKAVGYYYSKNSNGKRINNLESSDKMLTPQGGIHSTTRDLYNYFRAINNHQIVSKASQELLFQKHVKCFSTDYLESNYGYGFTVTRDGNLNIIGHGGTDNGVGSRFEYFPEQDIYVIVLSNYGQVPAGIVSDYIKSLMEDNAW